MRPAFTQQHKAPCRHSTGLFVCAIAGTYSDPLTASGYTMVIGTNGSVTGTRLNNCTFAGTAALAADAKAFNLAITFTNCGTDSGATTGKAMVIDYVDFGDARGLAFALKGTTNAQVATLRRQ